MPRAIRFPEFEDQLAELKKLQQTARSRIIKFKGNEWLLERIPLGESGLYEHNGERFDFSALSLTEFRKDLKYMPASERGAAIQREIRKIKGVLSNKYSKFSVAREQFGQDVHNKVSDFMGNADLTEDEKRKLRERYKNYNYEDGLSFSDFIDLYYAKGKEAAFGMINDT